MIGKLRKLHRLGAPERRCLAEAIYLLWRARLMLWIGSYASTRAWMDRRIANIRLPEKSVLSIGSVIRMHNIASRLVPKPTCLVCALAGELLLRKYGHRSVLQIGVKKGSSAVVQAHAWLEIDGLIVLGGESSTEFTRIYRNGPETEWGLSRRQS